MRTSDSGVDPEGDDRRSSLMPPERQRRLRGIVWGLSWLLAGDIIVLTPLWLSPKLHAFPQLPIGVGVCLAMLSLRKVGGAMAELGSKLEACARGRFAQSSLGMSLVMFYVIAFAIPVTALLLGTGHLPASGAHLADAALAEPGLLFRERLAEALAFSGMLSFIGASFYSANRLREHGSGDASEDFDPLQFWGGLWFRLGQAMLYTFCTFIYLWGSEVGEKSSIAGAELGFGLRTLPLIGLFIGMFVRAAEALVLGLAERVLQGVQRVVGPAKRGSDSSAPARYVPTHPAPQPRESRGSAPDSGLHVAELGRRT